MVDMKNRSLGLRIVDWTMWSISLKELLLSIVKFQKLYWRKLRFIHKYSTVSTLWGLPLSKIHWSGWNLWRLRSVQGSMKWNKKAPISTISWQTLSWNSNHLQMTVARTLIWMCSMYLQDNLEHWKDWAQKIVPQLLEFSKHHTS